ncbi:DUF2272 domain-containing protein [Brevundimonas aveniformis]|uniref:DUF2272 domain-containing protein n=1 Tax=Brevundimonas aveniformis TaxID=370977 RepID=UPI00249298D2|nr:DUF2272 domain-containing protein [Brevundimonas aveniformis]
MRTALAIIVALGAGAAQAQSLPRLPREAFDVIPPSDRVTGQRGSIEVIQHGCRVGPTSWARRRIVDIAAQEWGAFGFQTFDLRPVETRRLPEGVVADTANPVLEAPRSARHNLRFGAWESERRMDQTIAGYWSATEDGPRIVERQNRQWREGDGDIMWVEPWSAAFISWVMCEAGLGDMDQFRRDIAHWRYVDQAIEARDGPNADAAYMAYDVGEVALHPGDLLCNPRGGRTYRTLADRRQDQGTQAPLHCDIVVRVDIEARTAAVIGGNVVNGVSLTVLPLTDSEGGHLRPMGPDDRAGARVFFAHLSLQADPVEPLALDNSPTIRALSGL